MGRAWPVASIPDVGTILDDGAYILQIAGIEEKVTGSGKLMYAGAFRVVEPKTFAGSPVYENFVVGSDDDPDGDDPQTWISSIGARILRNIFKLAGVEESDDIDDMIAAAEDQRVIGLISRVVDDGKNDPKYKGKERNRINRFLAVGEREVGPAKAGRPAMPPARPPGAQVAKPKPRPVVEDEDDESSTPPPRRPGRPPGATAKPAAVPAKAADAPKLTRKIKCDICNDDVPVKEFSGHVAQHEQEEE